jgi:hypothetical protein
MAKASSAAAVQVDSRRGDRKAWKENIAIKEWLPQECGESFP